ncbi:nucleopolyhedrovirus P10 family protein [Streptomyces sp. NPDC002328]|uniref:nucleopolyhedrovirus P10 family protein n=1 Tax=Streptomyces sp. NPDC002328 TaxID=3364642 RepID=UPI0036990BB8
MTADRWTRAVREQLGLGRLLPLGGPGDGAWIAEGAARAALRQAVRGLPGVRLGELRIALADPSDAHEPAVPPPPTGLPPGPLRVTADFTATASEPLPATASRLREALSSAAARRLGLTVTEIDLRVTSLLDAGEEAAPAGSEPGVAAGPEAGAADAASVGDAPTEGDVARVSAVALGVPGVVGLSSVVGRAVYIEEGEVVGVSLARRHVRVQFAVSAACRAVDVARQVRVAVSEALPDHPTVAVLVTDVR